jgi:hypothetical protein
VSALRGAGRSKFVATDHLRPHLVDRWAARLRYRRAAIPPMSGRRSPSTNILMIALTALLALASPQGIPFPVVINEFSYDDSGTDDREFVELFNATALPIDIGGWVLAASDPSGPNAAYTIPAGTILGPRAFYVLGAATVPNVDLVVGTTDLWENDNEALTLRDAAGAIRDTLIYEANKGIFDPSLINGDGVWGNLTSVDGVETSWSRIQDGMANGETGYEFALLPSTPGTSNDLPSLPPYLDNFDARAIGSNLPDFGASFVRPRVVDPTVVGPDNPSAIPASPQGGRAAVFWDPSGGGNTNMLLRNVTAAKLECLVYLDARLERAGESESWSIGFGTTGSFYNTPDPSGSLLATANGNTGIAWTYQVTDTAAVLYLIDHNDGGWGGGAATAPTILAQIPIQPGVNDGWQRLQLEWRIGLQARGRFGGTMGCPDGAAFISGAGGRNNATTAYFAYREALANNASARPLTVDALWIDTVSLTTVREFGAATATTAGTPTWASPIFTPRVGGTVSLGISGLLPSHNSLLLIGLRRFDPGFPLAPLGGQVGSELLVDPVATINLATSPSGTASLSLPLNCDPGLVGASVFWQVFDPDPALGIALPFGNSRGLETPLGL